MKSSKIKNSVISIVVCGLLLTASQAVLAKKPVTPPPVPPVEIYSVVVNIFDSRIEVTGNGLDTVTDASLGSLSGITPVYDAGENRLDIAFDIGLEGAVPGPGNYLLTLNGTSSISVYFISAVIDPVTATCPCVSIWSSYGAAYPPAGFNGVDQYCIHESSNGDQVAVQFYNPDYLQLWILTSEFNTNATECALVIDEPTVTLNSQSQHDACSTYLKTNYIDASSAPDCGSFPSVP